MKKNLLGKLFVVGALIATLGITYLAPLEVKGNEDVTELTLENDTSYLVSEIFPDEIFRNIVIKSLQELSIPIQANGEVKQSELDQLKNISDFYVREINTLEGVENLRNLERISLNNTKIKTLDPLEDLNMLSSINITHSDISDVSALSKLSKNNSLSLNINLDYNKITDFTFIPELDENIKKMKKWGGSLTVRNQRVNHIYNDNFTQLPVEIPMPQILLHDGSQLGYESFSTGHFTNGNFILEKMSSDSRYFSGNVKKIYNDKIEYGVSVTVDTPNNYLFPSGVEQEFTINVNENFDFDSPFKEAKTDNNWGFLWAHTYRVNKEELDIDKPGRYVLNYDLIKFKETNNKLEGIPFQVVVNVMPVTYQVDFKADYWWKESYAKISTNSDMTITPPSKQPEREGYIFEGWAYDHQENAQLVDFNQLIRSDTTFYAKWRKDKPQGEYIKDGRYITVTGKTEGTWSNFDWDTREYSETVYGKTYEARGRYEHRNGKTYYSIFDGKGKWMGYIDANNTKVASGKQGIYVNDGHYVTVVKKGYNTWSNFSWQQKLPNNKLLNKTFLAKGKYVHVNGSTYYSLYDNQGRWHGYISAGAVKVGNGKQGAYISENRKVRIINPNYSSYSNFNWKKMYSGNYFTDTFYEARGKYHHSNGSTYYSLYNINGLWLGYMSEKALR